MALGTGSALAHRAVDSVLGSRHPEPAQAQAAAEQIARAPDEPCSAFAKTFADCMSDSNGELEACRYYFDKLQVRARLGWYCANARCGADHCWCSLFPSAHHCPVHL